MSPLYDKSIGEVPIVDLESSVPPIQTMAYALPYCAAVLVENLS